MAWLILSHSWEWQREILIFRNFIVWFGCSVAKNCRFRLPSNLQKLKYQNFTWTFFACTSKDHACQFLGKLNHFPETSSNFSAKIAYFSDTEIAIQYIRDFSWQQKPCLTFSFTTFDRLGVRASMIAHFFWRDQAITY